MAVIVHGSGGGEKEVLNKGLIFCNVVETKIKKNNITGIFLNNSPDKTKFYFYDSSSRTIIIYYKNGQMIKSVTNNNLNIDINNMYRKNSDTIYFFDNSSSAAIYQIDFNHSANDIVITNKSDIILKDINSISKVQFLEKYGHKLVCYGKSMRYSNGQYGVFLIDFENGQSVKQLDTWFTGSYGFSSSLKYLHSDDSHLYLTMDNWVLKIQISNFYSPLIYKKYDSTIGTSLNMYQYINGKVYGYSNGNIIVITLENGSATLKSPSFLYDGGSISRSDIKVIKYIPTPTVDVCMFSLFRNIPGLHIIDANGDTIKYKNIIFNTDMMLYCDYVQANWYNTDIFYAMYLDKTHSQQHNDLVFSYLEQPTIV